jgi:hypothetical protein
MAPLGPHAQLFFKLLDAIDALTWLGTQGEDLQQIPLGVV